MKKHPRVWPDTSLTTLKLVLDAENARIDMETTASQKEIRLALLETEEIEELAESIAKGGGRMAGERIVVIEEKGKYTVMEGNRRTCACQLLLDSQLIPKGYTIPAIDAETREAILNLKADVAPSREEADIIVTRRHTESGIKIWSTLANIRRLERMRAAGKSDTEIAETAGISPGRVRKINRAAAAMEAARNLSCWTADEKKRLSSSRLKTTAFTRFFELKDVTDRLKMDYGVRGGINSKLPKDQFEESLEYLARNLLLPDPITNKTKLTTRATPDEVFGAMQGKGKPSNAAKKPARYAFFEDITCSISDARCRALAGEAGKISHKSYPNASAFLIRAMLEAALYFCIKEKDLIKKLKADFHMQHANHKGKEPGLDFVMNFCEKNWSLLFSSNPQRHFQVWREQKAWGDMVIHGRWMSASPQAAEAAAAATRPFLEEIFNGLALI